jgi:addiction module HigA family antidote
MHTILKSQTTIRGSSKHAKDANVGAKRRLPKNRPPTHPGEMLLEEFLRPLGMSQVDFAARLGVSFPRLNEIIKGRRAVTPDTALRLGRVFGMSAEFWLGLQLDWDLWNAMKSVNYLEIEQLKPFTLSRRTLKIMDSSMANLKKGVVSEPIRSRRLPVKSSR